MENTQILSVRQTAEAIPALTESSIRWHLFIKNENGLAQSGALIQIGRRVYLDLPKYIEWLRGQGGE